MTHNTNPQHEFQLEQMKVGLDLIHTVENASRVMTQLSDAVVYLDFTNENSIQSYYDSLGRMIFGLNCLKAGFRSLAESYNLELVDNG